MDKAISKNLKNYLLIFVIFVLGLVLRFYLLGSIPVSMHRDEAYLSYNAYSILKTGHDISSNFLPVHLESFLFSPGGYSYFSIPFIAIFGLNEFSARFAGAFFGTLTIILIYFISLELFKENKNKQTISLLSSFFLSIMPWHINLSRVAVESTLVVFFVSLGVLLYLKYLKKRKFVLILFSFISFALNFFIYQAPRAFLPFFLPFIALAFTGTRNVFSNRIQIVLYFLLVVLPVIFILLSPTLSIRIQILSIFHHPQTKLVIQEQLVNDAVAGLPTLVSRTFHNKVLGYSSAFLDNYFSHLSYDFLFSDGVFPDRFKIPNMGLLYIYQLPLLILAFIYLQSYNKKINLFLFGWIGLSLLGSALTFDDIPNLQRTLIAAPPFAILSGYGAFIIVDKTRKNKYFLFLRGISSFVIAYSLFYFLMQYFIQGKVYQTWNRQDGYEELVMRTNELLPNYKKAIITTRETSPTIFFLFYSKFDPKKFQQETKDLDTRNSDHVSFYKYQFSDEECPLRVDEKTKRFSGSSGILYVNSSLCNEEIPGANLLYSIKRVEGSSEAFRIYEVK